MKDTLDGLEEVLEKNNRRVEEYDTEMGGVYLETTEDPRGWMLGDKTRRVYETTIPQILSLLNLQVVIIPNDDGSEIKVIVNNPKEIRRMLLSKNDDVGSSIEYAKLDDPEYTGLNAKMGEHVCIESFTKSGSVRAQIFPGSGMVDILKGYEADRLNIRDLLQKLVRRYYEVEDEIDMALSQLGRYGAICNCKKPLGLKQIHEGELEFDEIIETCLECGGVIEK